MRGKVSTSNAHGRHGWPTYICPLRALVLAAVLARYSKHCEWLPTDRVPHTSPDSSEARSSPSSGSASMATYPGVREHGESLQVGGDHRAVRLQAAATSMPRGCQSENQGGTKQNQTQKDKTWWSSQISHAAASSHAVDFLVLPWWQRPRSLSATSRIPGQTRVANVASRSSLACKGNASCRAQTSKCVNVSRSGHAWGWPRRDRKHSLKWSSIFSSTKGSFCADVRQLRAKLRWAKTEHANCFLRFLSLEAVSERLQGLELYSTSISEVPAPRQPQEHHSKSSRACQVALKQS